MAALLLSHYNKDCYSNVNLAPADVEYILQESATWTEENNVDGNYSNASGHGRLNAYQALKMIDLPHYQIVHPDTLPLSQQVVEQDTINIRVASPISEQIGGPYDSLFPIDNDKDYRVVRYKYQLKYDFSQYIQPSTTLLDTWVLPSQTTSLRAQIDTTWMNTNGYELIIDTMGVEPMCEIDSIVNDSIIYLSGNYYHFIEEYLDPLDDAGYPTFIPSTSIDLWYPMHPLLNQMKMAFSIYIHDDSLTSQYDFPCYADNDLIDSFATVYEGDKILDISLSPNPGTNQLSIRIPENQTGKIVLRDIFGRLVHEAHTSHNSLYFIDTGEISKGIYFVTYLTEGRSTSKKWIKQ